jgi:hypothetical protein
LVYKQGILNALSLHQGTSYNNFKESKGNHLPVTPFQQTTSVKPRSVFIADFRLADKEDMKMPQIPRF